MTPDQLARACAQKMWDDDQSSQALGITLDHVAPGQSRMSMTVIETMVNGHGICHGGYIFTLADSAFAFACNTTNDHAVAAHCQISYLNPAHLGDRLTATAEQRHHQGRSGITDVRITAGDRIIAEFRGHSRTTGGKFFPQAGQE